jgi:hypothetical protein
VLAHHRTGSGPALVSCTASGSTAVLGARAAVARARARRSRLDLPGFGESPVMSAEPAIAALADAVDRG